MSKSATSVLPNFGRKGWPVVLMGVAFFYLYLSVFDVGLNTLYGVYEGLYGWRMQDISLVASSGGWLAVFGVGLFGFVCKKFGAKAAAISGLLGCAVGFLLIGLATEFWMFTLGVWVYFFCAVAFGVIAVGQFGANWFPRGKGKFMGVATMGVAIAGATINPLMMAVIPAYGVQAFMFGFAAVCVVVALLVSRLKNYPEEAGVYPDNGEASDQAQVELELRRSLEYRKRSPWTTKKVLASKETWLVAVGWGLPMMVTLGVMGQIVPAFVSFGHDSILPVTLLSAMFPVGIAATYIGGVLDAKLGPKPITIFVVCLIAVASLIFILFGTNAVAATVGMAALFASTSIMKNMSMSMTTTVFGREDFENAWPVVSVVQKFIWASGLVVIAMIATTWSYTVAFAFAIGVAAVALVLILFTPKSCIVDESLKKQVEAEVR